MIDKFVRSMAEAMNGIKDGSTILIPGFGEVGQPNALLEGLIEQGATNLTLVVNSAGRVRAPGAPPNGHVARLIDAGRVRKVITSFVRAGSVAGDWVKAGKLETEVVPQGTLAERMRAAGAGIGGFYCPTGVGTLLAEGKETRVIDGRPYVLELPLRGDVALVGAHVADRMGNVVYRKTARNFGPVMATAATTTVVQVRRVVETGSLDPESIVTPSIFVDRVVAVGGGA